MYRIHRNIVWLTRASRIYTMRRNIIRYRLTTLGVAEMSMGAFGGCVERRKSEQQRQPMKHTTHTAHAQPEENMKVTLAEKSFFGIIIDYGLPWQSDRFECYAFFFSLHPSGSESPSIHLIFGLHYMFSFYLLLFIIKSLFFRLSTTFKWKGKIKWKSYNRRALAKYNACTVVCIIFFYLFYLYV